MSKQSILIIGGSSGMGLATAELMQKQDYDVAIAGRTASKLEEAAKSIPGAKTFQLDLLDESSLKNFFQSAPIFNHLVISAADFIVGPFLELDTSEARRFFDSKFWGQYTAAKYGSAKIASGGSITFFSGIASEKPSQGLSVASAINGAIEALTRALAFELAPLRVNAISPGIIETPVWNGMPEEKRKAFFQHAGAKLPARRIGQPEDIAQAVRFLIECPFMTGEVISCDGGGRLI